MDQHQHPQKRDRQVVSKRMFYELWVQDVLSDELRERSIENHEAALRIKPRRKGPKLYI